MRRVRALLVCAVLLAACSGSHGVTERPVVTTTTSLQTVPRVCRASGGKAGVRRLASHAGSVWVWIESAARPRFRVGSLIKVVWRVTGTGAPRTLLTDPSGHAAKLSFGPERHSASTFQHPGAEYGTGFTPTGSGCWRLSMQRGDVEGSVSFAVDP